MHDIHPELVYRRPGQEKEQAHPTHPAIHASILSWLIEDLAKEGTGSSNPTIHASILSWLIEDPIKRRNRLILSIQPYMHLFRPSGEVFSFVNGTATS